MASSNEVVDPRMKMRWITRIGIGLTLAWVVAMTTLAGTRDILSFELNEIGDFLAGAAAPPAFVWLILAFYQQGQELRLQADEFRHSVKELARQSQALEAALLHEEANKALQYFDAAIRATASKTIRLLNTFSKLSNLRNPSNERHRINWDYDELPQEASTTLIRNRGRRLIEAIQYITRAYGSFHHTLGESNSTALGEIKKELSELKAWLVQTELEALRLQSPDLKTLTDSIDLHRLLNELDAALPFDY